MLVNKPWVMLNLGPIYPNTAITSSDKATVIINVSGRFFLRESFSWKVPISVLVALEVNEVLFRILPISLGETLFIKLPAVALIFVTDADKALLNVRPSDEMCPSLTLDFVENSKVASSVFSGVSG